MAKVSIIIPVYNVESYLRECMDSVINQTLKDLEIICVNDGSTDNSRAILQEYADKDSRIKIIDKENGGLSSARNAGIKIATGEFIGFVDSDDWIDLNFYEKLYEAAVQYNADIACSDIIRTYPNKKSYYIKNRRYKKSNKTRLKYEYAMIPKHNYVWNKIYHRLNFLKTGVLFEEGVTFEDIVFSHKVIHYLNCLVTVPSTAYYYRVNSSSIVSVKSDKSENEYLMACTKAHKFIEKYNIIWKYQNCYRYTNKKSIHILFLPFLKIIRRGSYTHYLLFSLIPLVTVKKNDIKGKV